MQILAKIFYVCKIIFYVIVAKNSALMESFVKNIHIHK